MADSVLSLAALKAKTPAMYRGPGDTFFKVVILVLSASVIALSFAMAIVIWLEARPSFEAFGYVDFLTETTWDPVAAIHGTWPFIVGTLVTSFGALLLSVLPALGVAIFVSEYAPKWLANIINYTVDLLAAIPSVVVGLWGVFVLAPFMRDVFWAPVYNWAVAYASWLVPILGVPSTYNLATATLVLALMITPYTVALSRDAIQLVPREQREAAFALGSTRWEVLQLAVLPFARSGIIAGVLLSLARGLGETMAIAMLIGNRNRMPFTLFGPAATMPSLIINEFREAVETLHYTSIMGVGFYLFVLTIGINLIASYIQTRLTQQRKSV